MSPDSKAESKANSEERIVSADDASRPLIGKNIVLTGANGGLGRESALAMARLGATIILVGRKVDELEKVYDEIVELGGEQPAIYPIHLDNLVTEDYQRMQTTLAEEFKELHGLVCNAVYFDKLAPLTSTSLESFQTSLATGPGSAFLMVKALLPLLKGPAIAVLDKQAEQGEAFWGAYSVAKAGLANLWEVFSDEFANSENVLFCGFYPGRMNTALRARAFPAVPPSESPNPALAGQALADGLSCLLPVPTRLSCETSQYELTKSLQECAENLDVDFRKGLFRLAFKPPNNPLS